MSKGFLIFLLAIGSTAPTTKTNIPIPEKPPERKERNLIDTSIYKENRDCLAKNIYHEARGEPKRGKIAVANVTMNRLKHPKYPNSICEVVHQKDGACQFSWTCQKNKRNTYSFDAEIWEMSKRIASRVLSGEQHDLTGGALFFHANHIKPSWSRHKRHTIRIGNHLFYR